MASYGINMRASSGYVTDGAGETYSLGEAYPTTRGGLTFGWQTNKTASARDRASSNDRRLAGMVFTSNGGATSWFRIDLPAPGSYIIRLAAGDGTTLNAHTLVLKDNTTTIATIGRTSTNVNNFLDATGVNRAQADWPGLNASIPYTFSTTTFFIECGGGANDGYATCLAHVYIEESGGGVADLAGTATATATATGALNIDKPLAGAAQGQATASGTLLPDVPGFAFDTDTDCILGEIVGALTGIARETTGTDYIVRAYDVATGALVEESGTLTTDSNGRLPRWQDAGLAAATEYHLMFVRVSDGAIGCKLMETS